MDAPVVRLLVYVVYYEKQMSAPHAVRWLKSFVSAWKQVFSSFLSLMKKKKEFKIDPLLCMFFCIIFELSFLFSFFFSIS